MVEVFSTNVEEQAHAERLVALLLMHFPGGKINFDLQDCDRILRVEKQQLVPEKVIQLLHEQGYQCRILE